MNNTNKYETFIGDIPLWKFLLDIQKAKLHNLGISHNNQTDMFEQEWEIPIEEQMFM